MHNISNIGRNADRKDKKARIDISIGNEIDDKTKEDITDIDLSKDIKKLGLSGILSGNLKRAGVETLGELLNLNYDDLKYIRGIGFKGKKDILDYVHSLGYTIQNEPETSSYQERIEQGQVLLEDYGMPKSVYLPLYRAGIYTMEELRENPSVVKEIKYFGPKKKEILQQYLDNLESMQQKENIKLQKRNSKLKQENEEIQKRIKTKQTLLNEYAKLLTEREMLTEKERELDEKLAQIRGEKIVQPKQHQKQK